MTTLIPNSQASGVETYEEMFKEITKKLYGEEATQSLHTPMAHITPDVERSFTNLLSDRNMTSNDFDHGAGIDNVGNLKNDDHLTAFGLAALMQNGFATPNAILNSHTFQQMNKQTQSNSTTSNDLSTSSGNLSSAAQTHNNSTEANQEKCASLQHGNELSTWNLNSKSEAYPNNSKHYKSKKHEASNEHIKSANGLNGNGNNVNQTQNNGQIGHQKRYNCSNCPYSTDRRDLFTRHENIHKEDKPFHCYVCLKQFNRADHVKKHFLRMHRGLNYDIGRTKRTLPQTKLKKPNSSGVPYYNHASNEHQTTDLRVPATYHTSLQNQQHQQMEVTSQAAIIDQTNQHLSNTFHATAGNTPNHQNQSQPNIKVEKKIDKSTKKNDKRFVCCYCSWSGNDNWGLKRHLNTHTKPFVCCLCDYKAARSERLATHVFKVHNKKVCTKCNYLAENQNEYDAHVNDTHGNETRTQRSIQTELKSIGSSTLRNTNSCFSAGNSFNDLQAAPSGHTFGNWRSMMSGDNVNSPIASRPNGSGSSNQKRGAERLFQYFEADESDPEDYTRQLHMAAMSRNTASVAQDFHNAGGGRKGAKHDNIRIEKNTITKSTNYTDEFAIKLSSGEPRANTYGQENSGFNPQSLVRQSISPPANQMRHFKRSNAKRVHDCCKKENTWKMDFRKGRIHARFLDSSRLNDFEYYMHLVLKGNDFIKPLTNCSKSSNFR